ncbi:hypothetical protein [Mangrovicoccus algicola]|uniref:GcrA cell cycle regulator n=1 Tax=Mangrovicoccus algicola TaxID=2771008 RepID=A0A8J6YTP8_9RHOB|nr:hypothetical protein [Mangrovicoccus algicola]MBE3637480.1 hypothetical protein [Mangrovicoccus algicola]
MKAGLREFARRLGGERRRAEDRLMAAGVFETAVASVAAMGFAVKAHEEGGVVTICADLAGVAATAAAPVATPPTPRAAPETPLPAAGPWSEEEKGIARDMAARGAGVSEIGAALGRKPQGVSAVLRRLSLPAARPKAKTRQQPPKEAARKRDLRQARKAAKAPTAAPAPAPERRPQPLAAAVATQPPPPQIEPLAVVEVLGAPEPSPVATSADWAAHVAALPYGPDWTLQDDLALCEALMRGDGLGAVAAGMGAEKAALQARWRMLNRDAAPTIDGQRKLLAALRAQVVAP